MESYRHVKHAYFVNLQKYQKIKALGQKECFQNPEPPNLELYPLIHSILPNILKFSYFQIPFRKAHDSRIFVGFGIFCKPAILQASKKGTFFYHPSLCFTFFYYDYVCSIVHGIGKERAYQLQISDRRSWEF